MHSAHTRPCSFCAARHRDPIARLFFLLLPLALFNSVHTRARLPSPFVTSTILRRDVRRIKRRRPHLCTCNDGLPGSRPLHNSVNQKILAPSSLSLSRARSSFNTSRLYTLDFFFALKAPHSLHRRQSRTTEDPLGLVVLRVRWCVRCFKAGTYKTVAKSWTREMKLVRPTSYKERGPKKSSI